MGQGLQNIKLIQELMAHREMARAKCKCEWCVKWLPLIKRLGGALPASRRKDFKAFVDQWVANVGNLEHAQAKLDGSWPGWEWLPKEIERRMME